MEIEFALRAMVARKAGRTTTRSKRVEKSAGEPSSVTRTLMLFVPTFAAVGIQLNKPVAGSMVAPAGAPDSSVNVMVWAGKSESLAVAVKLSSVSAETVQFIGKESCGRVFTSLTATERIFVSLRGGVPLSGTGTALP